VVRWGTLDYWVKSDRGGGVAYAVWTVVRCGSEPRIFARRKRAGRELSLSFVVRRVFTQCRIRLSEWIISLLRFDMHLRAFLSFH
jgi:hypothetical protein